MDFPGSTEAATLGDVLTYGQYCPVARASEVLADRWTPLIVRELLAGSQHFNELERGLPGSHAPCCRIGCDDWNARALFGDRLPRKGE